MEAGPFLRKSNTVYLALAKHIARLDRQRHPERVLKRIELTARFISMFHSGRYADGRIENIAFDIGAHLDEVLARTKPNHPAFDVPRIEAGPRRHILHVATTIHDIGGHSKLICNWISNDSESRHSLLLINQGDVLVPSLILDAVRRSEGQCIVLPSEAPRILKAKWLRVISQSSVDFVVLHHHPYDSVPIVAFATDECCPIAVMNHADHVFWLGPSVADVVVCIRGFSARLSKERRFAGDTVLLPVPLSRPTATMNRLKARARLRIPEDEVVLLSIGAEYKYQPTDGHNFLRTAIRILDQNPAAHLYLIGVENNMRVRYLRQNRHERLHLMGIIENPSDHQLAADLYLEGFPWNSWIALLETCLFGVCPVLMHAPTPQLTMSEDVALTGLVNNTLSEDEYVASVNELIHSENERQVLAERIRQSIVSNHIGDGWHRYLYGFYSRLEGRKHCPHPIPETEHMQTADDLNLGKAMQAQTLYFAWKAIKLSILPSKRRRS
jgi:hypothetical protein